MWQKATETDKNFANAALAFLYMEWISYKTPA